MKMFKRIASGLAAAALIGCSAQPILFAPRPVANPNLVRAANKVTIQNKLIEYSANFEPTLANSFMSERPLAPTGHTAIKVAYNHPDQVTQLNEIGMDVWMVTPKFVLGQVNDEVFARLEESRLRFEMISPERGISALNTFDPKYHTFDEMLAKLRAVTQKHSGIATLHDIGDTWEKTQGMADRDIWAVHINGQGDPSQKPGIIFLGNHHARELATVEIPLLLIDLLTEGYGKDPNITRLLDTRDIWIVPMVNPDGHIQAETGANWRKNTHKHGRYRGTDLNRNYGHHWGERGASSRPYSDTYRGEGTLFRARIPGSP